MGCFCFGVASYSIADQIYGLGVHAWITRPFWFIWSSYIHHAGSLMLMIAFVFWLGLQFSLAWFSGQPLSQILEHVAQHAKCYILQTEPLVRLGYYLALMGPLAFTFSNIKCAIPDNHYFS